MSHLAYARKYRPNTFDEIIGQDHIATTLKNALAQDNIAHAYLFAGPRGIGKTSTARILAKALNCAAGPTATPCNTCPACVEIREGRSMDVLEIDGASNRGIDEIRTLRENVKFAPSSGRYKIYIIDEVHMLTPEAFNALLKTLEEPPAHVKFIFATTEAHRVLPTILSRCQRFDFHKISTSGIVVKLKKMAASEHIAAAEDALYAIARNAEGSLRDAEVVLDQLNSFSQGKVTLSSVDGLLGLLSQNALFQLAAQLAPERLADNLVMVDNLIKEGKDPSQLTRALLEHFRFMMLVKAGAGHLVELAAEDTEKLKQQSAGFSLERILYSLAVLVQAQERMKRQGMGRLLLEMSIIKLSEPAAEISADKILATLGRLEQQMSVSPLTAFALPATRREPAGEYKPAPPSGPAASAVSEVPAPGKAPGRRVPEQAAQTEEEPQASGPVSVMEQPLQSVALADVVKVWPHLVRAVRKEKVFLGECLAAGTPVNTRGSIIEIGFAPANEFQREHSLEPAHLKIIEKMVQTMFGPGIKVAVKSYEATAALSPTAPAGKTPVSPEPDEASADPGSPATEFQDFVQSAMDVFDGQIVHRDE